MPQGSIPLPSVTDVETNWDPSVFRRLVEDLREQELLTYNTQKDVLITGEPDSAGRKPRLILRAPDGGYWSVVVDNAGALSTESVDPLTFQKAGVSLV